MAQTPEDHPYGPNSGLIQNLVDDCRVLGPSGIERIAWGRQRHVAATEEARQAYLQAEQAAQESIEDSGRSDAWRAAESAIREVTEGRTSPVAWRSEHGVAGEPDEDATLHAAMALVVRDRLEDQHYRHLVKAMAEAIPWLLPDEPPDQYHESLAPDI